jgi:RNA polymerase sigma factor (sigma-70 family)
VVNERRPATARANQSDRSARIAGLVNEARLGSDDAVGEIVAEFTPLLWHIARAAGLSTADTEDVLQTVWTRLLTHLDGIRTSAALAGWLVTTTRREAWRVRAEGRRQVPADQESFAELPDPGPGSEEQVILDDQRRALWVAFGQLSQRCQELLRIVAFVAHPEYAAVGAQFGMPVGSIGPTRRRCLDKLRALLASDPEGSSR